MTDFTAGGARRALGNRQNQIDSAINSAQVGTQIGTNPSLAAAQNAVAKQENKFLAPPQDSSAAINSINLGRNPEQDRFNTDLSQIRRNQEMMASGNRGYDQYLQNDMTSRYQGSPYLDQIQSAFAPAPVQVAPAQANPAQYVGTRRPVYTDF